MFKYFFYTYSEIINKFILKKYNKTSQVSFPDQCVSMCVFHERYDDQNDVFSYILKNRHTNTSCLSCCIINKYIFVESVVVVLLLLLLFFYTRCSTFEVFVAKCMLLSVYIGILGAREHTHTYTHTYEFVHERLFAWLSTFYLKICGFLSIDHVQKK